MGRKRTRPIKISKYSFKVGEEVIYIGKLFEDYHNQEGIVLDRTIKQGEFYTIQFKDNNTHSISVVGLRKKDAI